MMLHFPRMMWRVALAFLLLLGCARSSQSADHKIPVVLSTDIGNINDDQWTVVYLLTHPDLNVVGVMSAYAPMFIPPVAHTEYRILVDIVENRLGMAVHPPLLEGSSLPLEDTRTPRPSPGCDFLVEASKGFSKDNRLYVLTIGAVTDVASAILRDPTIVDRIQIVSMGFRDWPGGGDDFNILNDLKAGQVIMNSDVPWVIGSAKVCREHLGITLEQTREMVGNRGPVGEWLWEDYQGWYYRSMYSYTSAVPNKRFQKSVVIWDNVVLAYVLGMTSQETHPRPRMNDDGSFEHPQTNQTITWITNIDERRMWADFLVNLDAYQRTHAVNRARRLAGEAYTFFMTP